MFGSPTVHLDCRNYILSNWKDRLANTWRSEVWIDKIEICQKRWLKMNFWYMIWNRRALEGHRGGTGLIPVRRTRSATTLSREHDSHRLTMVKRWTGNPKSKNLTATWKLFLSALSVSSCEYGDYQYANILYIRHTFELKVQKLDSSNSGYGVSISNGSLKINFIT